MLGRKYLVIALSFLTICDLPAWAGRTMSVSPYRRELNMTWGPAMSPGTKMGFFVSAQITIVNVSSLPQTGKIKFQPGTFGYGVRVPGDPVIKSHFFLCGLTKTGKDASSPTDFPTNEVSFAVDGNAVVTIDTGVYYSSEAVGNVNRDFMHMTYSPSFQIAVEENRGALVATLVSSWGWPVGGTKLCDNDAPVNDQGPQVVADPLFDFAAPPLYINGGRPF